MGIQAAVVGASGYAGGELVRLLAEHPHIELGQLVAGSHAGASLGQVHPQLSSVADRPLFALDEADLARHEVVFLALPHGSSAAVAAGLPDDVTVVDLGADFRIADATAWSRWYGGDHAGLWAYGLPELPGARAGLAGLRRVANPGCYATAIALALVPLLAAGVAEPEDLVVVAASGTTGAGRKATENLLASQVMGDLTPYKVGGDHQHLAEVRQTLGRYAGTAVSLSFTPVLAPMPRGILATCTARLRNDSPAAVRAAFDCYDDEPFVTVLPAGQWPHTASTQGSNSCHLQIAVDADTGRAVVIAAIDNLGKGAAGQAIQNANLMLGLPETTGLPVNGIAP